MQVNKYRASLVATLLFFALLIAPSTAYAAGNDLVFGTQASGTSWTRLAGETALGTMMEVVDEGFQKGSCKTVVIATDNGYWDALTASGLAGKYKCPVLLTNPYVLSQETRYEIARLGATTAVVVGGPFAVGNAVVIEIQRMGVRVERAYGQQAVDTALEIYKKGKTVGAWGKTAIVVTDNGYWDALSISPYSYVKNAPIFLASVPVGGARKLNNASISAIKSGGFNRVYICGGNLAVSSEVEKQLSGIKTTRLWGQTAIDTSQAIANQCVREGMTPNKVCIATDDGYWDGLTGAALSGKNNAPLILATPGKTWTATNGFIANNKGRISQAYILGGPYVVPYATETALRNATK